jgi:hypothetical protein
LTASVVAVVAGIVLAALRNWSMFTSVVYCMGLLAALQLGYLVGGGLSCVLFRAGSRTAILRAIRAPRADLLTQYDRNS